MKKCWHKFFAILGLLVFLGGCNNLDKNASEDMYLPNIMIPSNSIDDDELNQSDLKIRYAKGFTLEYYDDYKVLTVIQPWLGAEVEYRYILVPKNVQINKEMQNGLIIRTPIESIVTMSATYLPFLESISKLSSLVGLDDATYIYNQNVQNMVAAGSVAVVGGGAGGGEVNIEVLMDLNPDLIMTSASGIPELDAHPRLLEVGLPVVINGDYLESSPLGRAEWGIFIAAFFDLENEAKIAFDETVKRYEKIKEITNNISHRPTVFTNTDFQGSWYVPGGESYAALLLKDAGANYLWSSETGSGAIPLSFESVYERSYNADFWLNVGFSNDLTSLLLMDERYAELKAFKEGNVYNYSLRMSPNGGMDYFESGVAYPDLILADLVAIFHPDLMPDHTFVYYKKLQ